MQKLQTDKIYSAKHNVFLYVSGLSRSSITYLAIITTYKH